jgi:phosphate acetyltransferase
MIEMIDPKESPDTERYIEELVELRKHKGLTKEKAAKMMQDNIYFGTMLVNDGKADGLVSGAAHPTAHTFRPALQIIKTEEGIDTASSFFLMVLDDKVLFYADCAFNIQPDSKQLADIAIVSNDTAKCFDMDPKVALLSFSTKGSGKHPDADKVIEALRIVKEKRPDIVIDGEMQFDSAILPNVAQKKCPDSPVGGLANILIFPDIDAGNIGYKITERLAGALALGPISQGFKKPINDLSRGCSVDDIINITCITSVQAQMRCSK